MAATEDDEYEIPLRDQRYFGTGIKRKRIQFVQSTSTEAAIQSLPTTPSESAAQKYLSIVMNESAPNKRSASAPPTEKDIGRDVSEDDSESGSVAANAAVKNAPTSNICDVCGRIVASSDDAVAHESSIAHQIGLKHSHPPSHLDRRRPGLAVLESQGWDPDSRRGLGVEGQGILHPIKARDNPQKAGIGMKPKDLKVKHVERPVTLDAGKIRQMDKDAKKKAAKLRESFYRNEDVEKYLGGEGETNKKLDLEAFKRARRK